MPLNSVSAMLATRSEAWRWRSDSTTNGAGLYPSARDVLSFRRLAVGALIGIVVGFAINYSQVKLTVVIPLTHGIRT